MIQNGLNAAKGHFHLSREFMALISATDLTPAARGCYLDLLTSAAWADHETRRGLQRKGEACASERWWADKWKLSQSAVHKLLVKLEKKGWIKRTADSRRNVGGTVIQVLVGLQPDTNFIRVERAALKQMEDEEWSVKQRCFWMDLAGLVAFSAGPDREVGTLTRTSRWLGERWSVDQKTVMDFLRWLAASGWIEYRSADGFVRMTKGLEFFEPKTPRNAPQPAPQSAPQDSPQSAPQTSPQDFTYENRVGGNHNGTHNRTHVCNRVSNHNCTHTEECQEECIDRECNPQKGKQQSQAVHASRAGLAQPAAAAFWGTATTVSSKLDVQTVSMPTINNVGDPDHLGVIDPEEEQDDDVENKDQPEKKLNHVADDASGHDQEHVKDVLDPETKTSIPDDPEVFIVPFLRRFTHPDEIDPETYDIRKDHDWEHLVWYLEGLAEGAFQDAETSKGTPFLSILKSDLSRISKRTPTFVVYCAQRACDPDSKCVGAVFRILLRTASDQEIPNDWWEFELDPVGRIRTRGSEHPLMKRRAYVQQEARRARAIKDKPVLDALDTTSLKAQAAVEECFRQLEADIRHLGLLSCTIDLFLKRAYLLGCDESGRGVLAWSATMYPHRDLRKVPFLAEALPNFGNPPLNFNPRILLFDPIWEPPQQALDRHKKLAADLYYRLTGFHCS